MYAFRGSESLAAQGIQNGKQAGGMILYGTPRNPGSIARHSSQEVTNFREEICQSR